MLAYGKIACSSRIRSRSVSTAPFTFATGLPAPAGKGVTADAEDAGTLALLAAVAVDKAGACEATTCALPYSAEASIAPPIAIRIPIGCFISFSPFGFLKRRGEKLPLPHCQTDN